MAASPTIRFAPSICARPNPLAEPAIKTKAEVDKFIDTGYLVKRDRHRENRLVVIQVMKNQLLASWALTSS